MLERWPSSGAPLAPAGVWPKRRLVETALLCSRNAVTEWTPRLSFAARLANGSPMPELEPPPALPENAALFLDFDGTLVDLADTPDSIRVPAGLAPLLEQLRQRLRGRLAIVSGRSLADLDRHLPASGRLRTSVT